MLYICSFFNKRNKRKFRKTFKLSVEVCIVNTNSGSLSRFTARRLLVILWNGIKSNANDKCVLSGKSCNGDRGPIHFSGKIYLFHIIEKKINEDTAWSVPFLPTRPLWIRMLQACSMYGKLRHPPPVTIHKSIIIWFDWMTQLIIGVTIHQSHILVAMNSVRFLY